MKLRIVRDTAYKHRERFVIQRKPWFGLAWWWVELSPFDYFSTWGDLEFKYPEDDNIESIMEFLKKFYVEGYYAFLEGERYRVFQAPFKKDDIPEIYKKWKSENEVNRDTTQPS